MKSKLFRNARLFTPRYDGAPLGGTRQASVVVWQDGCLVTESGRITAVGAWREVEKTLKGKDVEEEHDLEGAAVIPGFVDSHTHACFAARREAEFSMRLAGQSYLDILEAGGGILSSVRQVRAASESTPLRNHDD